jgi:WD40 repeat protein
VLGLYEVLQIHGGGMGLVYRVRHLGWHAELAVKSPRLELFADNADRELFVREAETWVSLGVHPHLCACHYVRTLGGIPRVFAEYVDGGSLRDWIDDGRLYRGGPQEVLARILDIAGQIAWGMAHAHGRGVVHQDLKPANVLLDSAGTAKVTDFGLARTRDLAVRRRPGQAADASVLVTGVGMTPAYASPEQAADRPVGRRSDVWSFAVTVLEMFTGEVTWLLGPMAGKALTDYRARGQAGPGRPPMPTRLADLLAGCLSDDPADRPSEMADLAQEIADIYEQESGRAFPRVAPRGAHLRADELTNRALSMLDLDRAEEAERFLDEALAVDPQHLEATYNGGLLAWRSSRIADDAFVTRLAAVRAHAPDSWPARRLLAQVHLERDDTDAALPLLEETARHAPDDTEVRTWLQQARAGGTTGRCLHVLDGHTDRVCSVAVTTDGAVGLSGGNDGTVRVWDLDTGHCRHTLEDHSGWVNSVAVRGDGRVALSGGDDGTVRVWDLDTGDCLHILEGHTSRVNSVAMTANGLFALSNSQDGTIRVWELDTGRCRHTIGNQTSMDSVAVSVDARFLLAGGYGNVRVWELDTGQCLHVLEGRATGVARLGGVAYSSAVPSIAVTTDERFALTIDDRIVRVWDLATGDCLRTLEGHADWVTSVAVTADGRFALTGGVDAAVRVWDLATGRCLRTLEGHTGGVYSVAMTVDGRVALSGGNDGAVRVWRLPNVPSDVCSFELCRPRAHAELVQHEMRLEKLLSAAELPIEESRFAEALALLRQAREIPGHERDPRVLDAWRRLSLFSVRTGIRGIWQSKVFENHTSTVISVAVTADGRFALSGDGPTVRIWDLATSSCLHTLQGHPVGMGYSKVVGSVAVTADRRSSLTGQTEGTVRVWEPTTGRCLHTFLDGDTARWATVSADGQYVLTGSADGAVRVWELTMGRCLHTLPGAENAAHGFLFTLQGHTYSGVVSSVAVSADGQSVLTGGDRGDGRLRVWELATGRCLRTLRDHHDDAVNSVAPTADGRFLLSGGASDDRTVRVWELATGHCLHTLQGHTGSVRSVAVTADGALALSGGRDGTVRVWELATGRCLRTLEAHTGSVTSVAVSADGHLALSSGNDGTVRVWEIDRELEATEPADWDERAAPYLEAFLARHTSPSRNSPSWTDTDVDHLLRQLRYAAYGWLRPTGVKTELERRTRDWKPESPHPSE